ncbi:rod shape-determining protein RodA [Marmoricola endophyticus]|uniref:peptidoglycan glycosyltransferase n=1 Tax=Marmoricola endophyticus TaxID=2040280 RepID=A0A917F9P0_9ACTN|nr:rod shape-determining protein RodA [Marmoricola endophyticus]GGF58148.1 rod shape-determining protein RodA [Marmoricola endophyticus]
MVTKQRVRLRELDRWLLVAVVAILVVGTLLVWSATSGAERQTPGGATAYVQRHVLNIVIGLLLGAGVVVTDHRWVRILAPVFYLASLVGLLLVLVAGTTINGSRSWLVLGGMSLQPAELAKLAVVLGLAVVLAERTERRAAVGTAEVLWMLGFAGVPALLILAQPDLGTMLVLSATVIGILAVAGVPRRWLAALVGSGLALSALMAVAGVLKEYQVDRFLAFTDPSLDPRGAGYNTTQARIAIGNGGLFGEGLFHGSQTQSGFVPEQHTDFVFTVAGEELGLVGAGLLIALFGLLLWRATLISRRSTDMFGRVAAAGVACWFGFQTFQNIGMCLGIMPVTGVPLPLVSYGGSSMFASLMAVGLLLNIALRTRRAARPSYEPVPALA